MAGDKKAMNIVDKIRAKGRQGGRYTFIYGGQSGIADIYVTKDGRQVQVQSINNEQRGGNVKTVFTYINISIGITIEQNGDAWIALTDNRKYFAEGHTPEEAEVELKNKIKNIFVSP